MERTKLLIKKAQEGTFRTRKKKHSEKISYILGNATFKPQVFSKKKGFLYFRSELGKFKKQKKIHSKETFGMTADQTVK